jgi:hypothetical protein
MYITESIEKVFFIGCINMRNAVIIINYLYFIFKPGTFLQWHYNPVSGFGDKCRHPIL